MENQFNKIVKLLIISTIMTILSVFLVGILLIYEIDYIKKDVVKMKDGYEKSVVAFGDGWEIRLDNTIDYQSNCDELRQAFTVLYGSMHVKDSTLNK